MYIFKYYSEIIGYVDGIEVPRCVGENNQFKIFKFCINNGDGKRVQIVAWNEEIDRIEQNVKSNFVSVSYYYLLK